MEMANGAVLNTFVSVSSRACEEKSFGEKVIRNVVAGGPDFGRRELETVAFEAFPLPL